MNKQTIKINEQEVLLIDLNKPVKIDLGAGEKNKKGRAEPENGLPDAMDEWIHIDGVWSEHIEIVCDFAEIPLPDGVADHIHSADTIEHIITNKIDKTLREWNRITKIGGIFTGNTPNLHMTMIRYSKGELSLQDTMGALYGSQDSMWQQHYVTYTADTLKALLEKYGFGEIDLTGSPGYNHETQTPHDSWWLVWKSVKVKDL